MVFELMVGVGTMDNDRRLVWDVKEELVADNLAGVVHQLYLMKNGKILGMLALDEQAARVIVEVALPVVELAVAEQDLVAVSFLKEDGAEGTLRRTARHGSRGARHGSRGGGGSGDGGRDGGSGRSPRALRFSAGISSVLKRPPSAGAAALESTHHMPKVPPFG